MTRPYRGLTKEGKWVKGFLISLNRIMVWDKNVCMRSESYEVIPETVGQFTGLTDKNDKEAYHKDWYRRSDGQTACIRNFIEDTYHLLVWVREGGTFEIIENPELLKEND